MTQGDVIRKTNNGKNYIFFTWLVVKTTTLSKIIGECWRVFGELRGYYEVNRLKSNDFSNDCEVKHGNA